MQPQITVTVGGGKQEAILRDSLAKLQKNRIYVGIPESTAADRQAQVLKMLGQAKGKKRKANLAAAAKLLINNAQLMYLVSNGSPLRRQPPRPVIEPAITDPENLKMITDELQKAAEASLDGKPDEVTKYMKRAGLLASTLCKKWFTDPKNRWAPNAPSTIRRKGSSRPNIDTSSMRNAITYVTVEG
jgi:hypothetical protein